MPRIYTVEFDNITLTNAGSDFDIFEFTPARDKPIELLSVELSNFSDLSDAQEEVLRLRVVRGHTTSGSTPGATPTPAPISPNDSAAGFTVEVMNSTIASAGTAVNLWTNGWNIRSPGPIFPPLPQGYGYWCGTAATQPLLVVRCLSTATDDISLSGCATLCEYP